MAVSAFDDRILGALFGDEQVSGLFEASAQVRRMLVFESAYSRALGQSGVVDAAIAVRAAEMIDCFDPDLDDLAAGTARDGVPVPALIRQIKAVAPPDLALAIHAGATSQDVIDTALVLELRDINDLLATRLSTLEGALHDLSARTGSRPLMGRTRMQAAVPITAADRIATWAQPLALHSKRLGELRPRLERLQFGGAAGNRAALGDRADTVAAALANILDLPNPPRAWHAMRDGIGEYASWLSLVTGTLGKMAQDVALMAQQGIGEIDMAGGGGSSAMAHKQNPVSAELLVTLARFTAGQLGTLHQGLIHEQDRSGAAWALEWLTLPPMIAATARALATATTLTGTITRIGTPPV